MGSALQLAEEAMRYGCTSFETRGRAGRLFSARIVCQLPFCSHFEIDGETLRRSLVSNLHRRKSPFYWLRTS
jgi:hypothetical protein